MDFYRIIYMGYKVRFRKGSPAAWGFIATLGGVEVYGVGCGACVG